MVFFSRHRHTRGAIGYSSLAATQKKADIELLGWYGLAFNAKDRGYIQMLWHGLCHIEWGDGRDIYRPTMVRGTITVLTTCIGKGTSPMDKTPIRALPMVIILVVYSPPNKRTGLRQST